MLDRKALNNEVVVPSYREFCRSNALSFHFWDELPEEAFDPEIARRELALHREAMNLFNRLKPEFISFQGQVVRFQLTSWDGDFEYTSWPLEAFLSEVASEALVAKSNQRALEILLWPLSLFTSVALAVVLSNITSGVIPDSFLIPLFVITGGAFVWWFVERRPASKDDFDEQRLKRRLTELREKLAPIETMAACVNADAVAKHSSS